MSDKDDVRRAYDEISEVYAEQRSPNATSTVALDRLLEPFTTDARILDAGCGQGTPVLSQIETSTSAVGLDFSREQLRLATENAPAAALAQGDMTTLPFEDAAFDAVTAFHSLIHVPADDHQQVIDEFARVLRPGGQVLLSEGETEWHGSNPDWLGTGTEMRWSIAGAEATKKQFAVAGFSVVEEWNVSDELADDEDAQKPFFLAELR